MPIDEQVRKIALTIREKEGVPLVPLDLEKLPTELHPLSEDAELLGAGDDGAVALITHALPGGYVDELRKRMALAKTAVDAFLSATHLRYQVEWMAFYSLRDIVEIVTPVEPSAGPDEPWDPKPLQDKIAELLAKAKN